MASAHRHRQHPSKITYNTAGEQYPPHRRAGTTAQSLIRRFPVLDNPESPPGHRVRRLSGADERPDSELWIPAPRKGAAARSGLHDVDEGDLSRRQGSHGDARARHWPGDGGVSTMRCDVSPKRIGLDGRLGE